MRVFPHPSHSYAIARNVIIRGWRKSIEKGLVQKIAIVIAALFGLIFTAAVAFGAYFAGQLLVNDPEKAAEYVGLVPAALTTFVVILTAYITAVQMGDIDNRDGHLTTVPARDVVGGLLISGYLRAGGLFAGPLIIASVAFGIGANAPIVIPFTILAVIALTITAFLVGYPIGIGLAYLFGRSALFKRYKAALGILAFVAYFGLIASNSLATIFEPVVDTAKFSPIAWYADLALLPTFPDSSVLQAVGVLIGSLVISLLGVLVSVRLSRLRWYSDSVDAGERHTDSAAGGRLDSLLGRRTAWVARKSWLRARRAPIKLIYVAYPVFLLISPIQASFDAGHITTTLATTVALYGAWMTGALFTLNPFGDEGAVLSVTVTTAVSGRQFIGGLVAASALLGAPVTFIVAGALAILSPLPSIALVCTLIAAAVLPVLASAIAVGVGTSFPKLESTTIGRSREVVVPSTWAFVIYTLIFLFTAGIATGVQTPIVAEFLADILGTSASVIHIAGLIIGVVLAGIAAVITVRSAVSTFDTYTTEDTL